MTELIWDGKYVDGKRQAPVRVALPFQTIETVNESAADRRRNLDLFSSGRKTEWRNRLIWGDKKYVLPALLEDFAGKVDLIYIDPPFDTGADFSLKTSIPQNMRDGGANMRLCSLRNQASLSRRRTGIHGGVASNLIFSGSMKR